MELDLKCRLRLKTKWAHIHIAHNFTALPHFLWLDCGRIKCESASRVEPQPVRSIMFKMALIVVALACLRLMMLYWLKRRQAYRRRYWVHSIFRRRLVYGECRHHHLEVLSGTKKCLRYLKMKPETFHHLLQMISPFIEKRECFRSRSTKNNYTLGTSCLCG